jgi:flagellar hook-associated protein FlgK
MSTTKTIERLIKQLKEQTDANRQADLAEIAAAVNEINQLQSKVQKLEADVADLKATPGPSP